MRMHHSYSHSIPSESRPTPNHGRRLAQEDAEADHRRHLRRPRVLFGGYMYQYQH
jgi:hypothetical protein